MTLQEIIKEMENDFQFGRRDTINHYLPKLKSLSGEEVKGKDEVYWHELKSKIVDILFEANGTGSGAEDIIEFLKSQSLSQNEPTEEKVDDFLEGDCPTCGRGTFD